MQMKSGSYTWIRIRSQQEASVKDWGGGLPSAKATFSVGQLVLREERRLSFCAAASLACWHVISGFLLYFGSYRTAHIAEYIYLYSWGWVLTNIVLHLVLRDKIHSHSLKIEANRWSFRPENNPHDNEGHFLLHMLVNIIYTKKCRYLPEHIFHQFYHWKFLTH